MDNSLSSVVPRSGKSKHCHAPVYNRVDAVNNDDISNYNRNDRTRRTWSQSRNLVWYKYYTKWCHWCNRYNLFSYNRRNRVGSINNNKRRRDNRNNINRQNNRNRIYYQLLLYLCTIIIGTPVFAEEEGDTNVSNPVAAATGNVTNQAVQFQNNGASSRQIYGPNIQCNGSTMTFSPFYMGNHSKPFDEAMQPSSYTIAENWGFQINFMVPLDKSGYKQCKEMAKRYEEKMKLEYEITRAHRCADLMKKGFMYRPDSNNYKMCQDIVPIVKAKPPKKEKKWKAPWNKKPTQ